MANINKQTYDFSTVKGISLNQLNQHYKLYEGYVNKLNEIWSMPVDAEYYGKGNSTYSPMRCLKLGESYALDGVKLHELYFQNIVEGNTKPFGAILNLIIRDFKSYENFLAYLKKVGLSMRGWAVLTIDPLDNKLHIIGSDAHDVGAIWMSYPLLVMDVYEHAYMIDFGIDKSKYIDRFIENINWLVVNNRLAEYMNLTNLKKYCRNFYFPY
ncbi:Fe-Mn family superoxide dismutase [Clostridium tetanomorphum]|uniref:superoxide dismutase n=1 Tax=Clostridium tetanomorphum TaxID=1553 RepID=A0A923E5W4_CLOTT|nr:superoxide dismutase [Clostridium tetanomorphum]KAJ49753.1 Fe/Mn family superoxide dismutase [Clostridium tetanomorphum DSM 665]KAJ53148.1 Fe/Mn family superoxide dismutase [Clostridium tetanomorphum DSM 665]MBC2396943.1 superoxide dismutase [Clostridium tetanomorphum]MBP1863090.1 Fe-Mn family superoxide dismutase [Clostridium tetanomorphum]NRS84199.1 Fe-Mn family superoxide dismutase [Clostridium tetanomorphum]